MAKKQTRKTTTGRKAKAEKGRKGSNTKMRVVARGKRGKGKDAPPPAADSRVTTFKPNGASSNAPVLPEPAAVDLGPVVLPDPETAQKLLGELAHLNDRALDALARYQALKEATKSAKEKYDELAEMVINRLRASTHASDLPLFADLEQRETDQARMEAGPEPIPETGPIPVEAMPQAEAAVSAGEDAIPDDQIPF